MASKTGDYARRKPVQDRSRERQDRILRAGAKVLARYGYEEATTTRIAAAARVPVGSLYEYFPNREAVFRALLESEMRKVMQEVIRLAPEQRGKVPVEAIRGLVGVAVHAMSANRATLGVLLAQMPGVLGLPMLQQLEGHIQKFAGQVAWISPKDARSDAFGLKIYMLTNAVFGFLIRMATTPDPGVPPEEITEQVVRLVAGYLGLPD